jgi:glycosyltransferase involved in cell wall biosynthesis
MKILFLNNADSEGGSGRAATRLLKALRNSSMDASLLVGRKFSDSPHVIGPKTSFGKALGFARPTIEQTLFGISPRNTNGPFSPSFIPDRLPGKVAGLSPDIIHLHWVANMMRLETLRQFKAPMVWTMHDSWPFTGGCYVPFDCTRYRESCGRCPVLGSSEENDLSRRVWRRKQRAWQGLNLTFVAPSRWMAECARASSLFHASRIEVIPNPIDVGRFKPIHKGTARKILSLPLDKKLILFGAKSATTDRNKGFHLLAQALNELASRIGKDTAEVVVFGTDEPTQPLNLDFKIHYLGWFSDDISLTLLYSAADLFVLPSIQESLGYTVMEAMSCGTPCVAFDQGGVPDLIEHQKNGYLAKPYEPSDLARGIAWVLESDDRREKLSFQARCKVVQEFALERIADRHLALYRDIMQ